MISTPASLEVRHSFVFCCSRWTIESNRIEQLAFPCLLNSSTPWRPWVNRLPDERNDMNWSEIFSIRFQCLGIIEESIRLSPHSNSREQIERAATKLRFDHWTIQRLFRTEWRVSVTSNDLDQNHFLVSLLSSSKTFAEQRFGNDHEEEYLNIDQRQIALHDEGSANSPQTPSIDVLSRSIRKIFDLIDLSEDLVDFSMKMFPLSTNNWLSNWCGIAVRSMLLIRSLSQMLILCSIVKVLQNLIVHHTDPCEKYLPTLPILFCRISQRNQRIELVKLVQALLDPSDSLPTTWYLQQLVELSSWNPDQVDEPDYERRLNSYKQLVNGQDIDEDRDEHLCVFSIIVSMNSNGRPTVFLFGHMSHNVSIDLCNNCSPIQEHPQHGGPSDSSTLELVVECSTSFSSSSRLANRHQRRSLRSALIGGLLRSRLYSIGDQVRHCLCKCMTILGQAHFKFIFEELIAGLQRGYQHFVLFHTIHTLLPDISSLTMPFNIHPAVKRITKVFVDDFFNVENAESSSHRTTIQDRPPSVKHVCIVYEPVWSTTHLFRWKYSYDSSFTWWRRRKKCSQNNPIGTRRRKSLWWSMKVPNTIWFRVNQSVVISEWLKRWNIQRRPIYIAWSHGHWICFINWLKNTGVKRWYFSQRLLDSSTTSKSLFLTEIYSRESTRVSFANLECKGTRCFSKQRITKYPTIRWFDSNHSNRAEEKWLHMFVYFGLIFDWKGRTNRT